MRLPVQEMMKVLSKAAQEEQGKAADCLVVVLMSHGGEGTICGSDDEEIRLESIYEQFNNKNCPCLQGKPRLFFVQACRGARPQGTPQAPPSVLVKEASRAAPAPLDANARPPAGTAVPVPAERQATATSQPSPAVEASQEAMDTTPSSPLRGTREGAAPSLDRSKQKPPRVTAPGKVS
ncbi:hypothetical protein HPB48_020337 [Haemaphysalis longicornis]|uniref:Caspase family p20 domain-containing protein n=1 Tax=Haemaphysalis longicornis TaxID=44386 RepID=A0A9J6GSR8_HAELO|nr:hypothetical protein HPB48_020337 [Haemaphysalis longicornis]